MSQKIQVLVIDENGKPCKRGHSHTFNQKIKGSQKRFCTFIMIETMQMTEGTVKVKMCGDVPL